jgi:hypothetical protein
MLKTITLAISLTLAACGGGGTKSDTTPTAKAGVQLGLGEIKLIDVNKNEAVLIHADGTIEMPNGEKPAKVTADGKLVSLDPNDKGEVGFELHPDGSVKSTDGKISGPMISADGVLTIGDMTVSVDAEGNLIGGNPDAPKMRVEGATDANLKRTAMFVLAVMTTATKTSPPPSPSGS